MAAPKSLQPMPLKSTDQFAEWEHVANHPATFRMQVTGGWVIAVYGDDPAYPPSCCFVPDTRI